MIQFSPRDLIAARLGAPRLCLVVEDDSLIRLDLQDTLNQLGVGSCSGASSVVQALDLIAKHEFAFSVLDFQLRDGTSVSLAEALLRRGVPFLFLTAYGKEIDLPASLTHVPVLPKPFTTALLAEAVLQALGESAPQE
jgi:CheY-like chemotaxis protein